MRTKTQGAPDMARRLRSGLDMPVPLPRMCSVLAHELRSPISVLQGYVRLLQRQREADHPEAAMLEAMLDATGRLTTIARQASDLGNWLTGAERVPLPRVDARAVVDALAERVRNDETVAVVPPATPAVSRAMRADPLVLADAIAAVATSLQRDHDESVIEIRQPVPSADAAVVFVLQPRSTAPDPAAVAGRVGTPRDFAFDRGGAGLALVAASYVLDQHGASITPAEPPGSLEIRFPHMGGAQ